MQAILSKMAQKLLFLDKFGICEFLKSSFFCPRPGKRETGTSDNFRTLASVKSSFTRLTFVISEHINRDMASNNFSSTSSSDSEVSEMEDYDLEVEGSPNSSAAVSEKEGTQEAYANNPLADEEWLELYERERKEEEALEKMLQKRLNGTEKVQDW